MTNRRPVGLRSVWQDLIDLDHLATESARRLDNHVFYELMGLANNDEDEIDIVMIGAVRWDVYLLPRR